MDRFHIVNCVETYFVKTLFKMTNNIANFAFDAHCFSIAKLVIINLFLLRLRIITDYNYKFLVIYMDCLEINA